MIPLSVLVSYFLIVQGSNTGNTGNVSVNYYFALTVTARTASYVI